jgi:hypothetical protein
MPVRRNDPKNIHACLGADSKGLDAAFGPVVMRVNTQSAKGKPEGNPPLRFVLAVLRYLASVTWSRLSRHYRVNPFFQVPVGIPRVAPQTASPAERAALLARVRGH